MRKMRVLVAEDDADDRFIFDNFLGKRADIEILPFAENGLDVFSLLELMQRQGNLPDMIILDHNMPKMNGRQTLEQLKTIEHYADIPVFVYSTYADTQLIDTCTLSGATMVVSKPITNEGYQELMDNFLEAI
jgi:CheY-like chemotaxis protein